MGFFLVGRRRDGGALRLIADTEFALRQEAVEALAGVAHDPSLEAEVFIVDLDAATPVLLVERQAAGDDEEAPEVAETLPVVPEPEPEVPEPEPVPEPIAEAVVADLDRHAEEPEQPTPPDEPQDPASVAEDESLSDALRRATGALEAESVPAAESVVAQAEDAGWPWAASDAKTETSPASSAPPDAPPPAAADAFVPDALEEPAATEEPLVSASSDDDLDLRRPVVLGAYPEESENPPPMPSPAEEPTSAAGILGDLEVDIPPAPEMPAPEASVPPVASPALEAPAPTVASEEPQLEAVAAAPEPQAYEPGDSDLSAMTCDDCVYVNTCPNKDERDPSSCGSFQWKAS